MEELPPLDKRLTARVVVYLSEDEHNQLTLLCQQRGCSVSEMGRGLYRLALLSQEGKVKE